MRAALVLALLAAALLGFWQAASAPEQLADFDVGSHAVRAVRVFHVLQGDRAEDQPGGWAGWAGLVGGFRAVGLEGNFYPPLVHMLTGAVFCLTGPTLKGAAAVMVPFYFLLVLSAAGFARPLGRAGALAAAALAAASPSVFTYGQLFLLDLPLAALAGFSLWMLAASRGFREAAPSWALGVGLGLGALVKPTFVLFVGGPVGLVLGLLLRDRLREAPGRRVALLGLVAAALLMGTTEWLVGMPIWAMPDPGELGLRALGALAGVLFAWLCLRAGARGLEEPVRTRWGHACGALLVAGLLAGPWYLMMAPSLAPGLFNPNPVEPSGFANLPEGVAYYLACLRSDHVLLPFGLLALAGLPVALLRRDSRPQLALVLLCLAVSTLGLSIHGGRLARYTLAQVVPLAWLAAAALAALPERARLAGVGLVTVWSLLFLTSWLPVSPLAKQTVYHVWGSQTAPPGDWGEFPAPVLRLDRPPEAPADPRFADLVAAAAEEAGPGTREVVYVYGGAGNEIAGENLHAVRLKLESEVRRLPWQVLEATPEATAAGLAAPSSPEEAVVILVGPQPPPASIGAYRLRRTVGPAIGIYRFGG